MDIREGFLSHNRVAAASWQQLERVVGRLLQHEGFSGVRMVGQTGDRGADILAHRGGNRWLVQVKHRKAGRIDVDVFDETVQAARFYRADVPVIATNQFFTDRAVKQQASLMASGVPLQLWDRFQLRNRWERLPRFSPDIPEPRTYQEGPVSRITEAFENQHRNSALVVMATGLGKTFVAAEAIRRLMESHRKTLKVIVLAHTNELVYQLERTFWPLMDKHTATTVWNGYEVPDHTASITFACIDSVINEVRNSGRFPVEYDAVVIDECHHAGSATYVELIELTQSGKPSGPFLLGLTATPWRKGGDSMNDIFGEPAACIDIVYALKNGWLCNIDYRMHVDNINWAEMKRIHNLTPRGLNRTLFVQEWDDAVVRKLQETWFEVSRPRAIVFCGTIDHAVTMRDRINAMGFARAEALYSGAPGAPRISHAQRNRILCDFHDGLVNILCAVDILNEGIDLPDVNIVVFQRVTHSRRIFIQQLGRGLRLAEGKEKVVVLDFVSDIRRFAAGIELKNRLGSPPVHVAIGGQVRFMNVTGEDKQAEAFLREWLHDVAAVEAAGEDDNVLRFPPDLGQLEERT